MTVLLLASSAMAAPTNSSSPTVDGSDAGDDDPLEVSETGHSRRRFWRRLLKQVSGGGLGGGYGLGGSGIGGNGLNFLSQLAHYQNHNNFAHLGPHRGSTVYGGGGVGGYGGNVLHYPIDGGSHGGYYGSPVNFPIHPVQGIVSPVGYGPWNSGAWGLFGNYGLGGPDGLQFDTVWL